MFAVSDQGYDGEPKVVTSTFSGRDVRGRVSVGRRVPFWFKRRRDLLRQRLLRIAMKVSIGGYELMMHKPDAILAGIRAFMSLEDGDIVMTGTPRGVGQVAKGERFVGRIKSGDTVLVEHAWTAQ